MGWDKERQRYVQVSEFEVPIEGSFTAAKLVPRLNVANLAMSIVAMQDFSGFLGQKTSFEANLSIGGSPVGRLFMKEQERLQMEMDALEKQLSKFKLQLHDAEAIMGNAKDAEALAQKDLLAKIIEQERIVADLNKKATYGPSTLDRMGAAAEALIKKLDSNYSAVDFRAQAAAEQGKAAEKLQTIKAQKDEAMSEKLGTAKRDYDSLQNNVRNLVNDIKEKKEAAQRYCDEYSETHLNTKYNYRADYDIVGLTPIKYYYGIMPTPKGQKLVVAGAFAWSPALERDTRAILDETGQEGSAGGFTERFKMSENTAKKGEKSVTQWLNAQREDVDTFGMGRWYVDHTGTRYWLGCAYALRGNGAKANQSDRAVRLDAVRNLCLSLNVKFQVGGTKGESMTLNDNESEVAGKLQQLSTVQREGVDIASEGLSGDFTLSLENGQRSEPIRYYIAKVSQDDIKAAHKAVLQQAENAAKAHEASYRREGARTGANEFVKAAKNDKTPLAEGRSTARSELDKSKQPVIQPTEKSRDAIGNIIVATPGTNQPAQGNVQPFIRGDKNRVPDEF